MGIFLLVPAILSIFCAAQALGTGEEWGVWIITMILSSVGLILLWPVIHWISQRNIGLWLSYVVLLAFPGSVVFGIVQIVRYGLMGGSVLSAVLSLLAWVVLGLLSCFATGRFAVSRYGILE